MIERERENPMARMKDEKRGWAKKTFETIENGPGDRCASLVCPREREDFPIIYVFSPPRFFALQQIKRNPHPWGTLLDYSLFSSRFHGSPFAFRPPCASVRARVYLADCISILRSIRCPLLSGKKKNFFSSTLAKFCVVTLGP